MTLLEYALILVGGIGAGMINVIVGSGSLITFPLLVFFGVPPLVANMSNNVGLLPGGIAGAWGYRHELRAARYWVVRLVAASILGGGIGALLLLVLPETVFETVVPLLVALGVVLVIAGPTLSARARAVATSTTPGQLAPAGPASASHPWALVAFVLASGIYGGYFGAAQGVILIGLLSVLLHRPLQELNAIKVVAALAANAVAALVFVTARFEQVDWTIAAIIGVGTMIGGFLGARVGRSLPPNMLRGVIVLVGMVAILYLLLT